MRFAEILEFFSANLCFSLKSGNFFNHYVFKYFFCTNLFLLYFIYIHTQKFISFDIIIFSWGSRSSDHFCFQSFSLCYLDWIIFIYLSLSPPTFPYIFFILLLSIYKKLKTYNYYIFSLKFSILLLLLLLLFLNLIVSISLLRMSILPFFWRVFIFTSWGRVKIATLKSSFQHLCHLDLMCWLFFPWKAGPIFLVICILNNFGLYFQHFE